MLKSIRSILMETQAIRQHNPCIVQLSGPGNKQFSVPYCTLRTYPGDRYPEFM
ncbi:hypothetical protein AM336_17515 [Klebsiella aerogenes]|nr:hypothetical protein CRN78_10130 [Klebsiella aerogenes]ATX87270.1 hypothetical protein AM345_10455 [Klebsiella aerogenes]ATY03155.1 hypothetical protein AM334_21165 [Klebsiella aerogenes]ATY07235.1 hypothetical protein AM336_17515 [Klebsiella aerogenes]